MNKISFQKTFKIFFSFLLMILVSCSNLTTPKKITIQADPEIQASLGKIGVSLTDYFSVEKIQEMMGENENFKIYDYKHDESDENMRFLAKMDYSVSIDGLNVDGSLNELENIDPISFGYEEDNVTPSVLFSVPEINQIIDIEPVNLDMGDKITSSIKDFSSISFSGVQPGLIDDFKNQNLPYLLELCDNEFDSVTFGEGTSLDVGFNQITGSGVSEAKINGIAIFDAAKFTGGKSIGEFKTDGGYVDYLDLMSMTRDDAIVYEEGNSDLITGENLTTSLNLSNITLPKDICFVLNVSFTGGNDAGTDPITITTQNSKFSNVTFKRVTGFTTTTPIDIEFPALEPIDLSAELQDLKGAVIGNDSTDGEISFVFNNLPVGVTPTTKLSLTQSDDTYNSQTFSGLNISNQELVENKISLAGQKLNTNKINLAGSLRIEAKDADIDFTQPIEITAGVKINKFAEIYLLDSLIPSDILTQSYNYSLESIAEYVNQITFEEVGFNLNLCNGLPFDATMNLTSSFLGINNKSCDFPGNQTSLPEEATKITETNLIRDISKDTMFDLSVNINLPSTDGIITLQNITTGTNYQFYGQADLVIDWESVNFKLPDDYSGFSGSFPEEGGEPLDFSTFTNILGNDIKLSGTSAKLYISSDLLEENGPLSGATLSAKMKASYEKEDSSVEEIDLLENSSETVKIVETPNLEPDENLLIQGELPESSLEINNLAEALFSGGSNLKIEYDISLGGTTESGDLSTGITIKKSDLDGLSQSSEIAICMLIDLPIEFSVKQNDKGFASFNLSDLINKVSDSEEGQEEELPEGEGSNLNEDDSQNSEEESDLFGRTPEESSEESDFDIFEFIENAKINIKYENNTGIALTVYIEDKNEQGKTFKKEAKLGEGSGTMSLSLNYSDAEYIKNTIPFSPDVLEIQIPGSKDTDRKYNLRRDAKIDVTLQGSIKTDIDYTIDLANPENTEGEN